MQFISNEKIPRRLFWVFVLTYGRANKVKKGTYNTN